MKKLTFSTHINASKTQVWNALWDDANYRQWTAAFHEGSRAESDWQEGSKILFTDGSGSGMVSRIARLIPYEFMSFEHLGEMKDGVEDTDSAAAKGWSGAFENYTLREQDGGIELNVELDVDNSFADMFLGIFPKASRGLLAEPVPLLTPVVPGAARVIASVQVGPESIPSLMC